MKALVTGATGNLGSVVCEALGARDIEVRAGARNIEHLPAGTANVRFDYGDSSTFIAEMKAAYPDCSGEEDLQGIAAKLYPPISADRSEANKKAALDFFQLVLGDRDYEAARKYAGRYIQHDPRIGDGFDALVEALETNPLWKNRPKSRVDFKLVAADGDLVYLQTHKEITAKDDGSPARLIVVHVFRFNDEGKIDEHWTIVQSVKLKDSVSKHPLF